jgi:hypothetical protein
MQSAGVLSGRRRRNRGNRNRPSGVRLPYRTSTTRSGRTQCAPRASSRTGHERRRRHGQRLQHGEQLALTGPADPATAPAAEQQPPVGRRGADQQAAQPAGARTPAADHVVAGVVELDLDPVRRAQTRNVRRVHPLGHHSLQLVLLGGGHGGHPVQEHRRGHPVRPEQRQGVETLAAPRVRQVHQVLARIAEQVEDHVRDRQGGRQPGRLDPVPDVHPLGQRGERRPAGRVQHHHLAVHQRARWQIQSGNFRISDGHRRAGPREQLRCAILELCQDPDAVPLELVAPAGPAWQRARRREHRGQGRTGHLITIGTEARSRPTLSARCGARAARSPQS